MNIAVLSDSHDNIWKLDEAMPHLKSADVVIHCGDLVAPFMLKRIGETLTGKPVHTVWGNNDGDRFRLGNMARTYSAIELHGPLATLSLEEVAVAVTHYPEIAKGLALSGLYGLVCYGHDHVAHEEHVGDCLLLNPGELMGLRGRSTLALVELPGKKVEWVEL